MLPNQLSGRINVEVVPEQWTSSLTAGSRKFGEVWDGTGGVRWDRKKLLQPNLHVYGKNDTKIMVYNMRRCPKKGDWKNLEKKD